MKRTPITIGLTLFGALALACSPALAQDKKPDDKPKPPAAKPEEKKPAAKPGDDKAAPGGMDEKAMMEMMEKMGAVGEQHKALESNFVGEWTFVNKMWHGPEPTESTGTTSTKAKYGGRYVVAEHKGTMAMPGPDGKKQDKPFEGTSTTTYNNSTNKFQNTWIDSMSTGIFISEGAYDPSTKTYTYNGDMDCMGMKSKVRMTIKVIDKNKHVFEWHESTAGAPEMKTMEITYTRKGSAS